MTLTSEQEVKLITDVATINERTKSIRENMVTRGDLSTAISTHEERLHARTSTAPKRLNNLKGKLIGAVIAFLAAATAALVTFSAAN